MFSLLKKKVKIQILLVWIVSIASNVLNVELSQWILCEAGALVKDHVLNLNWNLKGASLSLIKMSSRYTTLLHPMNRDAFSTQTINTVYVILIRTYVLYGCVHAYTNIYV